MTNIHHYQAKRHIAIIESARGFAALYVVLTHVVEMLHLPKLFPQDSIVTLLIDLFLIYGNQAVLLFFVLSGFSIHYTSLDRNLFDKQGLRNYYYLRWRRIYPIFLLAIIMTYGIDLLGYALGIGIYQKHMQTLGGQQILYTFAFLTDRHYIDGILLATPDGNAPLWSLSYEVFYYLVYPLYWYINQRWGFLYALATGFVCSLTAFTLGKIFGPQHFYNVLDLYIIWCLGAVLAEMHRRGVSCRLPMLIHAPVIYVLLQSAWVLENATYTVGAFFDITWGLFFFFVMLLYLNPASPATMNNQSKMLATAVAVTGYLIIIAGVHWLGFVHDIPLFYSHITLTLQMFLLGLFIPQFYIRNICSNLLKPLYRFGKSSYGIYVVHYPILLFSFTALAHYNLPVYAGILIVPVILYLAQVVELHYQPWTTRHTDEYARRYGLIPQLRDKVS